MRAYLVQRLEKPSGGDKDNPLVNLSDALVNTGFSKGAMEILNKVLSFDYMGSSEFEWGEVPKSFNRIFKENAKEYVAFMLEGLLKPVHVVCKEKEKEEITAIIRKFAKNSCNDTKEFVGFKESLEDDKYRKRIVGWIDIENDFMWFTDKKMYDFFAEPLNMGR